MFERHPHARYIAATLVPVCWMACSSGLILLNKHLMMDSGMGQAFSALAAFTCCRVLKLVTAEKRVDGPFFATRILPVGLFYATTLMFGNAVYMYLSVSFIQMLKAFTPVITMLGLFIASLETPTSQLIGSVCVIAGGTAVASFGEVNMSFWGVLVQLASETAEALRLVMTQTLLQGFSFHPIESMMYLAPACVIWMAIGGLLLEFPAMARAGAFSIMAAEPLTFLFAASLGFLVTTLAFFTIKLCGSLTLKVLGTVKNAALITFCVIFLGDKVSAIQCVGYMVALLGFGWYQYVKLVHSSNKMTGPDKVQTSPRHPLKSCADSQSDMELEDDGEEVMPGLQDRSNSQSGSSLVTLLHGDRVHAPSMKATGAPSYRR